jgi:hypothetical protein
MIRTAHSKEEDLLFKQFQPEKLILHETNVKARIRMKARCQLYRVFCPSQLFKPPVRARCVACEFRNYCADIW